MGKGLKISLAIPASLFVLVATAETPKPGSESAGREAPCNKPACLYGDVTYTEGATLVMNNVRMVCKYESTRQPGKQGEARLKWSRASPSD